MLRYGAGAHREARGAGDWNVEAQAEPARHGRYEHERLLVTRNAHRINEIRISLEIDFQAAGGLALPQLDGQFLPPGLFAGPFHTHPTGPAPGYIRFGLRVVRIELNTGCNFLQVFSGFAFLSVLLQGASSEQTEPDGDNRIWFGQEDSSLITLGQDKDLHALALAALADRA